MECHAHEQAAKDDSDDDLSDDDSDDDTDGAPVMHLRQISQPCGINRVRSMPQQSSIIATWGEDARVQVSMYLKVPMLLPGVSGGLSCTCNRICISSRARESGQCQIRDASQASGASMPKYM